MNSKNFWYFSTNGKTLGPYPESEIRDQLNQGRIDRDTLVCSTAGGSWAPLGQTAAFQGGAAPPPPPPPPGISGADGKRIFGEMGGRVAEAAGLEKLEGFDLGELLSEVFKKHSPEEVEERFAAGSVNTTPSSTEIDAVWPKPWVFFRALAAALIAYMVLRFFYGEYSNIMLLPALMIIGSFAVPVATLLFFFESNVCKNVSIYQLSRAFIIGGVISLVISHPLYEMMDKIGLDFLGASIAAIVEEPAKLAAVLVAVKISRFPFTLNGLLFGAAVGTGFAAFESSGYAFYVLIKTNGNVDEMFSIIQLRGVMSPFAHIAWTAASAAAFWQASKGQNFAFSTFKSPRFIRVFIAVVLMHAIWNANFELPLYLKYIALGFVAWVIVLSLLQTGLKEVRRANGQRTKLVI